MPYRVPRLTADKLLPPPRLPLSAVCARMSLHCTGFLSPGVSVAGPAKGRSGCKELVECRAAVSTARPAAPSSLTAEWSSNDRNSPLAVFELGKSLVPSPWPLLCVLFLWGFSVRWLQTSLHCQVPQSSQGSQGCMPPHPTVVLSCRKTVSSSLQQCNQTRHEEGT